MSSTGWPTSTYTQSVISRLLASFVTESLRFEYSKWPGWLECRTVDRRVLDSNTTNAGCEMDGVRSSRTGCN